MARSSGAGPLEITVRRQSEGIEWAREYLGHICPLVAGSYLSQSTKSQDRIGCVFCSFFFAVILRTKKNR